MTLLANPTTRLTNRDALDRMAAALRAWATLTLEAEENVRAARRDVDTLDIGRPCSEQELADVEMFTTGLLGLANLPALVEQLAPEPEHGTACTCCERNDPAASAA
jgi:hypothetical protein